MTVIPTIDIVDALAAEYATKSPREILELALSQQGEIAISFSGAEDVVLIILLHVWVSLSVSLVSTLAASMLKRINLLKLSVNTTILISKFVSLNLKLFKTW